MYCVALLKLNALSIELFKFNPFAPATFIKLLHVVTGCSLTEIRSFNCSEIVMVAISLCLYSEVHINASISISKTVVDQLWK